MKLVLLLFGLVLVNRLGERMFEMRFRLRDFPMRHLGLVDGRLVYEWLYHFGYVRLGIGTIHGHGIRLVHRNGVRLIHGHWLWHWIRFGHGDQFDFLLGHQGEVSSGPESVAGQAAMEGT